MFHTESILSASRRVYWTCPQFVLGRIENCRGQADKRNWASHFIHIEYEEIIYIVSNPLLSVENAKQFPTLWCNTFDESNLDSVSILIILAREKSTHEGINRKKADILESCAASYKVRTFQPWHESSVIDRSSTIPKDDELTDFVNKKWSPESTLCRPTKQFYRRQVHSINCERVEVWRWSFGGDQNQKHSLMHLGERYFSSAECKMCWDSHAFVSSFAVLHRAQPYGTRFGSKSTRRKPSRQDRSHIRLTEIDTGSECWRKASE